MSRLRRAAREKNEVCSFETATHETQRRKGKEKKNRRREFGLGGATGAGQCMVRAFSVGAGAEAPGGFPRGGTGRAGKERTRSQSTL